MYICNDPVCDPVCDFAGFVNMTKMVYLSAAQRERLRNLMMV